MKILFLYKEEWEKDYIVGKLEGHEVMSAATLEEVPQEELSQIEILSVFVHHECRAQEMDKLPSLKLIAARSTGFDYIDVVEARKRGIEVVYVPSYGENTVAEFTFALLLSLSRKIPEAHEQVIETGSFHQGNLRGFDIFDKTLGVVGTGRIGVNVIKMARGFGMKVVAYDPFPKYGLDAELGFAYVGFEDLLGASDIISLHAPYSEHTHHMINMDSIYKIKRGAVLINTARGGLLETASLVKAIEEGIISAVGLDVLEEEGDMGEEDDLLFDPNAKIEELKAVLANNYLINHPRVIITPHIAYNTDGAVRRIVDTTIDNINSFIGGEVKNKVPA